MTGNISHLLSRYAGLGPFFLSSLFAIICGSLAIWATSGNIAIIANTWLGWISGAIIAALWIRYSTVRTPALAVLAISIIGLAATFADPGLSGVHRWMALGPLRANLAALLLPLCVTAAALHSKRDFTLLFAWLAIMGLIWAQPDASQATAMAFACPFAFAAWPAKTRWPLAAVSIAIAALSWLQPDPLQPVAEVEGIINLMWSVSPALAIAGILMLLLSLYSLWHPRRQAATAAPFVALTAYFAIIMVMPAFGHFPVPLLGAGLSVPLGIWLGLAWATRPR